MKPLNLIGLAKRYQVSRSHIRKFVRDGFLPAIKFGRCMWFDPTACDAALYRKLTAISTWETCWDQPRGASADEPSESLDTSEPLPDRLAWCGVCGFTVEKSVIKVEDTSLCLACGHVAMFRTGIRRCGDCDEAVTGEIGDFESQECVRCYCYETYEMWGETPPEYMYDRAVRRINRLFL